MFNIKLEKKSYKMSLKALPVEIQLSKNRQKTGLNISDLLRKQIYLRNF